MARALPLQPWSEENREKERLGEKGAAPVLVAGGRRFWSCSALPVTHNIIQNKLHHLRFTYNELSMGVYGTSSERMLHCPECSKRMFVHSVEARPTSGNARRVVLGSFELKGCRYQQTRCSKSSLPNLNFQSVGIGCLFPLVDVSDIFYFFLCSGRGKGESEAPRMGGRFLLKIPGGWGGFSRRGLGPRVSAANWGIWGGGGGAKYFFFGPKCPPSPSSFSKHALRQM